MTSRAGALIALALVAGCQTRRQAWIATGVSAGITTIGVLGVREVRGDDEPGSLLSVSAAAMVGGGLATLLSLVNALVIDDPPAAPAGAQR